jgi:hypothetical protein
MRRAAVIAGVVLAVLVVAQLALPRIAERRLKSDLERHGTGVDVSVSAFPAVKLLWHKADDVNVTVADYEPGPPRSGRSLADDLASTKDSRKLDVHIALLRDRRLRIHDITLRKDGDNLVGQVRLRRGEVNDALPPQLHLRGSGGQGGAISVSGRTSVFGHSVNARARILVDDRGRIVLKPSGFPLAGLVTVPLFADDRIAVDAIEVQPATGGFAVTARGHLR